MILSPLFAAALLLSPANPPRHVPRAELAHRQRLAAQYAYSLSDRGRAASANVRLVYGWSDGALYPVTAAPERVTDIALQPGEQLISVAAGDTARWVIGDTSSGSGATKRIHLIVKPMSLGLKTNLLIATDRRTYHLALKSAPSAMAAIGWTYPQDELMALQRAASAAEAAAPIAGGLALEQLNFSYAIHGDRPSWRPLRAFDDGRQVFIQFPPSLLQGNAPPLFVLGATGKAELVNYRIRGSYYVVDRLFDHAELRLGERKQQIVRISRTGASPAGKSRA